MIRGGVVEVNGLDRRVLFSRARAAACAAFALVTLAAAPARGGDPREPDDDGQGGGAGGDDDGDDGRKGQKKHPSVEYEPGEGIRLRARDGDAKLTLSGMVQPLIRLRSTGPGDAVEAEIARARLEVHARLPHGIGAELDLGFDGGEFELRDAFGEWSPGEFLVVQVGRFRPPSGLERETSVRDQPFVERSGVASLASDREIGVSVGGDLPRVPVSWRVAVMRGPRDEDFDGARNVDVLARVVAAPDDRFAASVRGGVLFRPDGAEGIEGEDPFGEEYFGGRDHVGTAQQLGADVCLALPRFRLLAEVAVLREGLSEGTVSGHVLAVGGYALAGLSPFGERDEAEDAGALRRGLEIVGRVEALRFAPAPGDGEPATLFGIAAGVLGLPAPPVRLGAEVWYGIHGEHNEEESAGARRLVLQLSAMFRL